MKVLFLLCFAFICVDISSSSVLQVTSQAAMQRVPNEHGRRNPLPPVVLSTNIARTINPPQTTKDRSLNRHMTRLHSSDNDQIISQKVLSADEATKFAYSLFEKSGKNGLHYTAYVWLLSLLAENILNSSNDDNIYFQYMDAYHRLYTNQVFMGDYEKYYYQEYSHAALVVLKWSLEKDELLESPEIISGMIDGLVYHATDDQKALTPIIRNFIRQSEANDKQEKANKHLSKVVKIMQNLKNADALKLFLRISSHILSDTPKTHSLLLSTWDNAGYKIHKVEKKENSPIGKKSPGLKDSLTVWFASFPVFGSVTTIYEDVDCTVYDDYGKAVEVKINLREFFV